MVKEDLKILFVSSEVAPFAKTGGLADVSGSLPQALHELGNDIRIILPKYKMVNDKKFNLKDLKLDLEIFVGDKKIKGNLFEGSFPNSKVKVYFVNQEEYFFREGLYQDKGIDYADNLERYIFFSRAALEAIKKLNFKADIIHANDWQSALIPIYLKNTYNQDDFFKETKTIFTIHNLGYQGLFPKENYPLTALSWELFNMEQLEFYDQLNLLKGGIIFSDIITTVSRTYAGEIQTKEFGCGLEGVLQKRSGHIFGILNGVDYNDWSPQIDQYIIKKYDEKDLSGKLACKKELQKIYELPPKNVFLMAMITRLADQKGLDLVAEVIDEFLREDLQLVVLGTGEPKYHNIFENIKKKYPQKVGLNLGFNIKLSHEIEAGADAFLMPSHYEPCGLNQIYSLKYGTIPIVRHTGGLADTIIDIERERQKGNGFVFHEYSSIELLKTIKRAHKYYLQEDKWEKLIKRAMQLDFSWGKSAKEYQKVYYSLIQNKILLKH